MEPKSDSRRDRRSQILAIVAVALCLGVAIAIFFVEFLVVPLVVMILFHLGFATADRAKRDGRSGRLSA